jgi:hypothetical protein
MSGLEAVGIVLALLSLIDLTITYTRKFASKSQTYKEAKAFLPS